MIWHSATEYHTAARIQHCNYNAAATERCEMSATTCKRSQLNHDKLYSAELEEYDDTWCPPWHAIDLSSSNQICAMQFHASTDIERRLP
jgi:hypothetical protein